MKVICQFEPSRDCWCLYVFGRGYNGNYGYWHYVDSAHMLEFVSCEQHTRAEPFMELGSGFAESFLPLLANALNEAGVKMPEKSYLEGKLEATEKHLNDLRHLVKGLPHASTHG